MKDDLISRQAAIDAIRVYMNGYKEHIGKPDDSEVFAHSRGLIISIERSINALPSEELKRGKWRHYEGMLTCLECGADFYDEIMEYTGDEVPHFCPDCGANMEAKE